MTISPPTPTETVSPSRCAECQARLAHDQRYCVACGARRGPLPAQIAALIGAIHERGSEASLRAGEPLAESLAGIGTRPPRFEFVLPGPRTAAVAVMGMLAFGLIVGSLVGGTPVESLANAPLIVVGLSHPAASQSTQPPAAQTITDTQTDASGGDGAPAAAAPAPSQAPVQAAASPTTTPLPAGTTTSPPPSPSGLPPVKHVFLIVLSDRGFSHSFGTRSGYLSGALRRQGELVQNYYAVAGSPLANEIALTSGQGPTPQTAADCPVYSRIQPAHAGPRGQVLGTGCVYPARTKTLANQLTAAGHTWRAYIGGVSAGACRFPRLGSHVPQTGGPHAVYVPWRDPFLFFRSLTSATACRQDHARLGQLATDLKSETSTPSLAYIIAPVCADGSEAPCRPGAPSGLAAANRLLKSVVPEIKRSPAYTDGGLIAITFDQAPQSGPDADPSACCANPASYPNLRTLPAGPPAVPPAAMGAETTTTTGTTTTGTPGTGTPGTGTPGTGTTGTGTTTTPAASLGLGETTPTGGGGQVGLLLISPYVKRDSVDVVDYFNHFSLLASIESLFGLPKLGYAGARGLPVFGPAVYNRYTGQ